MKTLILSLCLLCLIACSKSNDNPAPTSENLKIEISNLGTYTDYLIRLNHNVQGIQNEKFEGKHDTTLTSIVNSKDRLDVEYNLTSLTPGTNGEPGTGTIKFIYKGKPIKTITNGVGNIVINVP